MTVAPLQLGGPIPFGDLTFAMLYRRVSKEEMADAGKVSLETQDEDGRGYIDRLPRTRLLGLFTDLASGRKDARRDYQRMLGQIRAEVAAGRRVIVVVAHLARFGRRMTERVRAWEELKALGVEVHSVREGGLITEVMYNLMAAFAQEEVRLLSERVTRSNRSYREKGWLRLGAARWGYRWRAATGAELAAGSPSKVLEEDPETGPYLRELWERKAAGESLNSLTKWVKSLPPEAKGRGYDGRTRVLSYAGLRQIFDAPVYVARHGTIAEDVLDRPVGKWTALVTDEQWAAVHGGSWSQRPYARSDGRYPLTGLLWCEDHRETPARMVGRTIHARPRDAGVRVEAERRTYACSSHIYGGRCHRGVPARTIEAAVVDLLQRILDAVTVPGAAERARELARAESAAAIVRSGSRQLAAARAELTKAETRLTEAWLDKMDKTLTEHAYAAIQARLDPRIEELKCEIAALEGQQRKPLIEVTPASVEMLLAGAPAWQRALADAALSAEGRRAIGDLAGTLIERVWPVRVGHGRYRLEVLYRPAGLEVLKCLGAAEGGAWAAMFDSANALYQLTA